MIYQDIPANGIASRTVNQCFKLTSEPHDAGTTNLFLPDGLLSVLYLAKGSFSIKSPWGEEKYKAPKLLVAFFVQSQEVVFSADTIVYGQTFYTWMVNQLGLPGKEIQNHLVPIEMICPLKRKVYEQLAMLEHETQIPHLIQTAILDQEEMLLPAPLTTYMQKVVASNGHLKISAVLPELNMSERQFQQKFLDAFGITPKHYLDLCKFNFSKALLEKEAQMSLSAIAQWSGYCDQSHFIRHFKRFSGRSPKVLRKEDIGMGKYFGMYQKRAAGF